MKALGLGLALVLLVAGCSDTAAQDPDAVSTDRSIRVEHIAITPTTQVVCVLWDAAGDGGLAMSCNWPPEVAP